jgi:DNA-directed RNA polymerase specialized sigma24 family protein
VNTNRSFNPSVPSPATRAAYAALYARHQGALRAFAKALLGRHADAEDVVQEVFTTAWQLAVERPSLPPPPISWLQKEVKKLALEMRARRAIERPRPIRPW